MLILIDCTMHQEVPIIQVILANLIENVRFDNHPDQRLFDTIYGSVMDRWLGLVLVSLVLAFTDLWRLVDTKFRSIVEAADSDVAAVLYCRMTMVPE